MIYRPQQTLKQRLIHFWRTHASHMDMVYATTLLYVLAIIVLAVRNDPCPLEEWDDSTQFTSTLT